MKEVWNKILTKLTSRKLWVAVIGIVVGMAAAFGIEENEYAQIAGLVITAANTVAYIIGEAKIDAAKKGEAVEVPIVTDGDTSKQIGFCAPEEEQTAAE